MTPDPSLYRTFANYNRWMNSKIYDACDPLGDAPRKKDMGAFFGSIHGTLNHLIYGDRAWMGRFTGDNFQSGPPDGEAFAVFADLRRAREELDAVICAWTTTISADWLAADTVWTSGIDGMTRRQPNWLLASHMFNHQTHHRGQVTALLSQLGVDIGPTDLPWLPDFTIR